MRDHELKDVSYAQIYYPAPTQTLLLNDQTFATTDGQPMAHRTRGNQSFSFKLPPFNLSKIVEAKDSEEIEHT